ncbi:MAG: DUF1934 domain-containing protein [Clostridia bacterium]|nr:DUF1934 domain-containing protein [Clostridia bacterium]
MSRVLVSITGQAQALGQTADEIRLMTTGTLTPTLTGYQLDYQESQPDGTSVQDIRLEMTPTRVTMTRTGEYGSTMVFEKGRQFEGVYHTPFGEMDLAVFPTKVRVEMGEEAGKIHLQYQLNFQGSIATMNDLTVQYRKSRRQS